MKHIKKGIAVFFCVGLMMWGLTGCASKEAVSVEVFNEVMEEKGYEIIDASEQYSEDVIEAISLALCEDYQIEFYVFSDSAAAAATYNQNKSLFEEERGTASVHIAKSIGNYSYFNMSSDGIFYLLARVDNTMLYVVADADYKGEIEKIIKELGY